MKSNITPFLLQYAARKAARSRFFLAEYLTEFSSIHKMDEDKLAQFLGCSSGLIPKLALCRRPDPESMNFRSEVEQIAVSFNLQPLRLAQLIREVEALKALAEMESKGQEAPDGLLAVARDDENNQSIQSDVDESSENEEGGK